MSTIRKPLSTSSRQATNLPACDRLTREDLERLTEDDERNPFMFEAQTGLCFVQAQAQSNQQTCVKQVYFEGVLYSSRALKFFWETDTWPDLEEARPAFWKLAYEHSQQGVPAPLITPDLPFGLDLFYRIPMTLDAGYNPIFKIRGLEMPVSRNWVDLRKDDPLRALIEVISIMRSLKKEHPSPYARFRAAVGFSKEQLPWWQYWATGNWARLNWEGDYSGASLYALPLLADIEKIVQAEEKPAIPNTWTKAKSHKKAKEPESQSLQARQRADREAAAKRSMEEIARRPSDSEEMIALTREWKRKQIEQGVFPQDEEPLPTPSPLPGPAARPQESVRALGAAPGLAASQESAQAPPQALQQALWDDPSPWEPVP